MIVTTVYHPSDAVRVQALEIATFLEAQYVRRDRNSLAMLKASHNTDIILVVAENRPVAYTTEGELFFHLSMAELRIKNLRDGKPDHMANALQLSEGMTFLDCTLGLATDSIVASYLLNRQGTVIGLEASPLIAFITGWGLTHFLSGQYWLTPLLRRIQVKNVDYRQYLVSLPDDSVDVVYFDPMFRKPVHKSSSMKPLRGLAESDRLDESAFYEACRVARKRVVVKETRGSFEFQRLGITKYIGGKYSSIQYGVLELEG